MWTPQQVYQLSYGTVAAVWTLVPNYPEKLEVLNVGSITWCAYESCSLGVEEIEGVFDLLDFIGGDSWSLVILRSKARSSQLADDGLLACWLPSHTRYKCSKNILNHSIVYFRVGSFTDFLLGKSILSFLLRVISKLLKTRLLITYYFLSIVL